MGAFSQLSLFVLNKTHDLAPNGNTHLALIQEKTRNCLLPIETKENALAAVDLGRCGRISRRFRSTRVCEALSEPEDTEKFGPPLTQLQLVVGSPGRSTRGVTSSGLPI